MLQFLLTLGFFLVYANGLRLSNKKAPSYHVNNVNHKYTSDAPSNLKNAMNRTIVSSFSTDDFEFELDLELNTKFLGKNSEIYYLDSNKNIIKSEIKYRAYVGTGLIKSKTDSTYENAVCSLNFYKDLRFHSVCNTNTDTYTIDLIDLQTKNLNSKDASFRGPLLGTDSGHGMVLTIKSEVSETPVNNNHIRGMNNNNKRRLLNDQSQLVPYTDCFDGQYQYVHGLYIGIITDTSYNSVYSNDNDAIESSIEALFNDDTGMNMIYYYQLNVQLIMGTVYIGESYSTTGITYSPATISSGLSINTRLDYFNTWRKEYYEANDDSNGLWHLLTNNHAPPGTVGLAWVGSICSYNYGTGVSNYINPATSYYGTGTWETMAHEVGHNFGASHAWGDNSANQGKVGGIMDYSDGLYPISTGAYQFHPTVNRDQVCDAITDSFDTSSYRTSWKGLIPLANCWFETTTDPTPEPTARPTNSNDPTPAPTYPTNAPTARPTLDTGDDDTSNDDDTSGISDDDGNTYVWKWFDGYDDYSECDLECVGDSDTAYKTKDYSCYKQTITGTSTSGSTTTTYYSYSRVDDSYCDSGTKPTETIACTTDEVPSCNNECGDGIVGVDEVCDTRATDGNCCSDDCSQWRVNSVECFAKNSEIDAAFQDNNGAVYLFQDQFFAKYSDYKNYGSTAWTYNTPDDGYPKSIEESFPISSWTGGITAIAYASDSEIYVFKDLEFVKIDLNSGQYSGYPKTFNEVYKVVDDITSCGSITGAFKYPSGDILSIACNNVMSYASASYTINQVTSLSSYGSSYSGKKVTGMYNTPGTTSFVLFVQDMVTDRRRLQGGGGKKSRVSSILANSNITSFEQITDQSCTDMNCKSCSSEDKKICYDCYDSYVLYGSVKCLSNTTLLYLNFDIDSSLSIDHYFVEGGYDTLSNDYEYSYDGLTGENTTAIIFDSNTKLELTPLDLDDDETVNAFRISFRFKPYSITYNKLLTIDNELVEISLMDNTNGTNVNGSANYIALFTVGNNTYQSSIGNGILLNDWNILELQFSSDSFVIFTNGETISQAYSSDGDWSNINVNLKFDEWYIGDDNGNSIVGEIDQVWFKIVDSSIDTSTINSDLNGDSSSGTTTIIVSETNTKGYQLWFVIGLIAIGVSVLLGICLCCLAFKYHSQKQNNQVAYSQYTQMQD